MLPQDNTPIDNDVNEANIAKIIDELLNDKNLEHKVYITTTYPNELAQEIDEKIQIGLQLSKMCDTNQPDANFIDNLESKLMQAHPYNTAVKITENQSSRKFWRKPVTIAATILLCLSGAIAIPYFNSGKLNLSISNLLKPITGQKANAVTLAKLEQEYGLTVTSDTQEYDAIEDTLVAIGNVTLNNPKSKFKAQADKIEWVRKTHGFILTGNVKLFQQGKIIKGEKFSCFILENKCIPHKAE